MTWKILSAFVVFLLSCHPTAVAQEDRITLSMLDAPTCGSPLSYSDLYLSSEVYEGATVTKVVSGNTVVVTLRNGKRRRVKLGGVEAPPVRTEAGKLSRDHLSKLVLNKQVSVALHGGDDEGEVVGGLVSLQRPPLVVNLAMLESGMGRYGLTTLLGTYEQCTYRLAAERAMREKKGLWNGPSSW